MSAHDRLLPCPWCGSNPIRYEYEDHGSRFTIYNVLCHNQDCQAEPRVDSIESQDDADALWNTRAPDQRLADLEKLRDRVMAAPVVTLRHHSNPPIRAVTGVCADGAMDVVRLAGQRVRLVPVAEEVGNG